MAKARTDDPTDTRIDESDGEKTGISAQVRVDTDPHLDPTIKLVSVEQLERSDYVAKIGHAARHMELDERDPSSLNRQVAGISALAVDDGVPNNVKPKA